MEMKMKEYKKPVCSVLQINLGATLLAGSMEGGEIGGTTDHFDAKRQTMTDFDDNNDW